MKIFTCVLFFLMLLCRPAQAFVETFDSSTGWAETGSSASTFDVSGGKLRAYVVRDVNDGIGRYVKSLGSTFDLNDVNDNIYLEADVQVVGGFNNFGSIYIGVGRSDANNFKDTATARLYWADGDLYHFYGSIFDGGGKRLMAEGENRIGLAGVPYRIKAQFSNKKDIADVNRLSYVVKAYYIKPDGSTGDLAGESNSVQTTGTASLCVNQVGIFICNTTLATTRYLTANIDNVYVSSEGWNPSPVRPSWYNSTGLAVDPNEIYETFTVDPTSTWTTVAEVATGCSFTWTQRDSNGYMDVVLTRRDVNDPWAQFYRDLVTEVPIVNSGFGMTESYGIYWFVEYDAFIVDADSFSEGLIGTGSTRYSGPWNDQNIFAGAYYGAQEVGDGMRATLVGYSDYYPAARRAATVAGLLVPGKSYRMKCAAVTSNSRTRMVGAVYTINPDGKDGSLVAASGTWQGAAGENLYADVMGIFSTMQTTTTNRTMNLYVDNIHFSTTGFRLGGVKPTWMVQPPCSELAITGDVNADCSVDKADLKIMADNWLKVGN